MPTWYVTLAAVAISSLLYSFVGVFLIKSDKSKKACVGIMLSALVVLNVLIKFYPPH